MIDINTDELLTLSQAAKRMPGRNGTGVNVSTIWRWVERGVGGHRLETCKVGGCRYTSVEALERFIAECSSDAVPASTPSVTAERRIAAAEAECIKMGV